MTTPMNSADAAPRSLAALDTFADRERKNPFYRWLMHLGFPGVASILIHVVLLSLLALRTFTVEQRPEIDVGDYSASVTESLADKMSQAFQWNKQPELESPKDDPKDLEKLTDFTDLSRDLDTSDMKPDSGNPDDGLGQGEGRLSLLGTGTGAGEAGTGGFGGGLGGGGSRFGSVDFYFQFEANKVVFVLDYSGSIVVAVDDLKRQLKRTIASMKDWQAFDVILFYGTSSQDRATADSFGGKLMNVTEDAKRKFNEWIEKKAPVGGSEPMLAIQRAIAMRPEAIVLLSDGLFDEQFVAEIKRANGGRCRIHTLVFDELLLGDTSGLPKETDGAKRLRRIAEQNGGRTKIVTAGDLNRK